MVFNLKLIAMYLCVHVHVYGCLNMFVLVFVCVYASASGYFLRAYWMVDVT